MSFLLHALIAVSYAVVATVAGYFVPVVFTALSAMVAPLIAAGVFILGLIAHVAFVGGERHRRLSQAVGGARLAQRQQQEDFDHLRREMRSLRQDVGGGESSDGDKRYSKVVAEVKILQGLIEQFYRHTGKAEVAAAARAEATVAAMDPGSVRPAPRAVTPDAATPDAATPDGATPDGATPDGATPDGATPVDAAAASDPTVLEIVREALRLDRVDVYLQPIVSLPQRRHCFYECFTRIRADDGSVVLPDQYIPLAEREGLVTAIDNMLLFRCVQLIRRTQRRNRDTIFFCNISHESLGDLDFFNDFVDFIADNRDLAPGLVFEVRQADMQAANGALFENLRRLVELGFRFSLDQVTHFEMDLEALARAQFHYIKADAGRLLEHRSIEAGEADIRRIKRELDRHGVDLIIEKIETEQQLVELLDFNIDYGQGYLFGEPRLSKDG